MESASVAGDHPAEGSGDKGLKKNAIGFLDGLSIGLASTAPAYSLAAVIGSIVVAAGVQAPAILLTAFIPMFFIAAAFFYMNGEESSEHRQALEEVGQRVTVAALERARRAGVDAEVALRAERSVDALLSLAEERDARAIVVGTYGEHPIKGAILGSTPHKLLHLSERPVLVVPASS